MKKPTPTFSDLQLLSLHQNDFLSVHTYLSLIRAGQVEPICVQKAPSVVKSTLNMTLKPFTANLLLECGIALMLYNRQVWQWSKVVSRMLQWVTSMNEGIRLTVRSRTLNVAVDCIWVPGLQGGVPSVQH